jgi:hypothetical protein
MNSINNKNVANVANVAKNVNKYALYCKVCADAGKPMDCITSHNVRNGDIVTCPTLNSQKCNYCKKESAGHTVKFCPQLAEDNKRKAIYDNHYAKEQARMKFQQKQLFNPAKPTCTNVFDILDEQSDDDDSDTNELGHTLEPAFRESKQLFDYKATNSYANMLKTNTSSVPIVVSKTPSVMAKPVAALQNVIKKPYLLASGKISKWVNAEDSDDDEDDDEDEGKVEKAKKAYFEEPFEDCVSSLVEDGSAW